MRIVLRDYGVFIAVITGMSAFILFKIFVQHDFPDLSECAKAPPAKAPIDCQTLFRE